VLVVMGIAPRRCMKAQQLAQSRVKSVVVRIEPHGQQRGGRLSEQLWERRASPVRSSRQRSAARPWPQAGVQCCGSYRLQSRTGPETAVKARRSCGRMGRAQGNPGQSGHGG